MSEEAWKTGYVRCLGVRLAGDLIGDVDERGEPMWGDTILLLMNAHYEAIPFMLRCRSESTAGLALLVALAEVGLWLGSTRNFDYGSELQQYSASQEWFEELGISFTPSASTGSSSGSSASPSSSARARSATAPGRTATARGRTSA